MSGDPFKSVEPGRTWSQDILAGVGFLSLAGFALYILWDHPLMRGKRVATGYFPKILVALIAVLALVLIIRGMLGLGERVTFDRLRPIFFVVGSFLVFGLLVRQGGFFLASMASVTTACLAEAEYKPLRILTVSFALSVGASILFIELLGIPIRLFPW